jgi:hypothetical protein
MDGKIFKNIEIIEILGCSTVGIVLLAPQQASLVFKLIILRYARITQFFHELDAGVYRTV